MIALNLISEEFRKQIKFRHLYLFVKKISLALMAITICVAIILLVAKTILQTKFNNIVGQTTLVTKNNQGYNNKIREINNKINFIAAAQSGFVPWSKAIKIISDIAPANISFDYFKINLAERSVKIKGNAGLRDSLLYFKKQMEDSGIFANMEFPIKNILEKENVDFEINAKINYERL